MFNLFNYKDMMKKLLFTAFFAIVALGASAQERFYMNTYSDLNIAKFDGKTCNVTATRLLYHGWNTIAMPFSMTEEELNETFGSDCRLERLVGAGAVGNTVDLYFQDCKEKGLEANTPYILYYTGENMTKRIVKTTLVTHQPAELTVSIDGSMETVTMGGAEKVVAGEGLYGVLAIDNADAKFVQVGQKGSAFYPTRCFIRLSSGDSKLLNTVHMAAGEVTRITDIAASNERVDVYNTAGVRVASQIRAAEVSKLPKGVYVVKGHKLLVK